MTLVASRIESASLKELMESYGRFSAYLGALLAYIGVLSGLGSNLSTFALITAAALIILFVAVLTANIILRRRARAEYEHIQERPESKADTNQQVVRRATSNSQEANTPEKSAVDSNIVEQGGRR